MIGFKGIILKSNIKFSFDRLFGVGIMLGLLCDLFKINSLTF